MWLNLELASERTSLNFSGEVLATLAKVSIPAATNASAAFGPAPSIFLRSSPFEEAFAFLAFGSSAFTSFFSVLGAAFLPPFKEISPITISVKD